MNTKPTVKIHVPQEHFIPNSFQTPNAFVDKLMPYLTSDEWKVLTYAMRRIFGFNKRQDRIALSQFTDGVENSEGELLDEGTGMSRPLVVAALGELVKYRVLICLGSNHEGTLYALPIENMNIDFDGLRKRRDDMRELSRKRVEKLIQGNRSKRERELQSVPQRYRSEEYHSGTDQSTAVVPQSVPLRYTQNTVETQRNTVFNPTGGNEVFPEDQPEEPETFQTPEELGFTKTPPPPSVPRTAEEIKASVVKAVQRGADRDFEIKSAIMQLFRLTPNWNIKANRDFLMWAKELPADQSFDRFSEWWYSMDWRGKTGQDPTLKDIRDNWLKAFRRREAPDAAARQGVQAVSASDEHTPSAEETKAMWDADREIKRELKARGRLSDLTKRKITVEEAKEWGIYQYFVTIQRLDLLSKEQIQISA